MSHRKQRSVFDQISEFDRGRIVAYRDFGLSFREIDNRVGRNQTTLMRICDRWITTDVSTTNGAMKEGCGWQNGMKLSLMTSHASVCNTTMVGFESGDTVERRMLKSCAMHHHTGPAPGIMAWSGIAYHSRTPLVRITGGRYPLRGLNSQYYIFKVLEPVVLPYLQGLATAIFQQDNALPQEARIVQRFFVNHQIELLPWPVRSPDFSLIENIWFMVVQRMTQITPPAATPD
ncbi:transposable element Tcb1 transposase [Trichonephila clavipes]|nr:transposable element Tcb1 transposase [Trichonephila clavipes]